MLGLHFGISCLVPYVEFQQDFVCRSVSMKLMEYSTFIKKKKNTFT
jgi:hypothetical protein